MTDQTTPAEAGDDEPTEAPEGAGEGETTEAETEPSGDQTTDQPAEPEDGEVGNEAARYRHKLRAAESERDEAVAKLDAARRKLVEDAAELSLHKPASLWLTGADPADFFDADDALDSDKVREAAIAARDELGLQESRRGVSPREGSCQPPLGRSGADEMTAIVGGFE